MNPTQLIHTIPIDEHTGATSVPIYQTSAFVQGAPSTNGLLEQVNPGNPTRVILEKIMAELEGGDTGLAFTSGLAAIDSVIKLLEQGDEIIAVNDIYNGTY